MIRNFHDAAPKVDAVGGNGYLPAAAEILFGHPIPMSIRDNLSRVNAHGGPGADRRWQTIAWSCGRHPIW